MEKAKKERDELKLTLEKFQNSSKSLNNLLESQVCDKFKTGLGYNATSPAVESFVNSSVILEYQENNKSKSDKGYHAVPLPYTRNFIPSKPDLMFMDEIVESENIDVITIVTPSNVKVIRPVWNNSSRVNHKNFANKMTHPHPNRRFVPQAVLTRSGKINTAGASVNTAVRPVNTAGSKTTVNHPRPISNFYEMNDIKREFSVARTPQQNGVAKRRNRTLIEAARTMVLVIKPHTKTPYELIRGRTPLIDFMKPFGCHVTILNTRDHLGNGPDWLFDVNSLTISMNYVPVVAGNQTNGIAGTRDNIVVGQVKKKTEPKQEYILVHFCITDPLISQCPKGGEEDVGMKPTEVNESGASDKGEEDEQDTRSEFKRLIQQEKHTNSTNTFNIVGTSVSAVGPSFTNDDPSTPVNAAEASNAFEDHLFERFSPFKNAFALPHVPNVFSIDDTRIFGNAYDDDDMEEPKKVIQALLDPSWVEAMQEELLLEAHRLFFAYASFMGFIMYQMDMKSAFLYCTIKEEVYVCQPLGFEDPHFLDKVYKVEKALYGLHQAPRACLLYVELMVDAQEILDEFYGGTHFLLRIASTTEGGWNLH
ncbi:retrovirus-related pol polyprotein from transposon TNT 1-94 [Tanacetum coccineum]